VPCPAAAQVSRHGGASGNTPRRLARQTSGCSPEAAARSAARLPVLRAAVPTSPEASTRRTGCHWTLGPPCCPRRLALPAHRPRHVSHPTCRTAARLGQGRPRLHHLAANL